MMDGRGSTAILQRSSSRKRKFNHRQYYQSSHSKKLRSKIPRKKRLQLSPIFAGSLSSLLSDEKSEVNSAFPAGSSSSSCFPDEISCASNWLSVGSENVSKKSRSSSKRKNSMIRGFGADEIGADVQVSRQSVKTPSEKFRRITRLYLKQKENERATRIKGNADIGVELSECSCVESFSGLDVYCRSDVISARNAKVGQREVAEQLEESEATAASTAVASPAEVSYKCNIGRNVDEFGAVEDTSERGVENATDLQHYEVSYISLAESLSEPKSLNDLFPPTSEMSGRFFESISAHEKTTTQPPQSISDTVDKKSEQITAEEPEDFDLDNSLACTECLSYDSENPAGNEMTVSEFESEIFSHSFDMDSDFSLTSHSDFSERSAENSAPPVYFPLFLQYTKQLCRLSSPLAGVSGKDNDTYLDEFAPLRFEDAEQEESYTNFRSRERKVSAQSYSEAYSSTTDCGDLILQQRFRMVNWIVEQSKVKELQGETVFLAVTLLDRFLTQGFFKNKRKLQVLGIACLTLATRIEENQPHNCVRQNAFHVGNSMHSKSEVIAMEWVVQKVLNFQLFFPTTYNFLWFYLKAGNADAVVEKRAKYLAFMSLLDHERLCYPPSSVAAGIVILASLAANRDSSCQRVMETHVRTTNDDLSECLQSLEWLVKYVC